MANGNGNGKKGGRKALPSDLVTLSRIADEMVGKLSDTVSRGVRETAAMRHLAADALEGLTELERETRTAANALLRAADVARKRIEKLDETVKEWVEARPEPEPEQQEPGNGEQGTVD